MNRGRRTLQRLVWVPRAVADPAVPVHGVNEAQLAGPLPGRRSRLSRRKKPVRRMGGPAVFVGTPRTIENPAQPSSSAAGLREPPWSLRRPAERQQRLLPCRIPMGARKTTPAGRPGSGPRQTILLRRPGSRKARTTLPWRVQRLAVGRLRSTVDGCVGRHSAVRSPGDAGICGHRGRSTRRPNPWRRRWHDRRATGREWVRNTAGT